MLNADDPLPSGARAVARCDMLGVAPFSDMADGLYRAYLTPAHRAALEKLAEWMAQAGMAVSMDTAANLIGRIEGTRNGLPPLIIGSHIDSVRDGGRYDGPLGIMLGIEAVASLTQTGRRMPFPIEIYAFGDEEGSRFPAAMLTSRAVAGVLDPVALEIADPAGVTLEGALAAFRQPSALWTGPAEGAPLASYSTARHGPALAYFEAHIEQGPVLEAEGLALGTVTGIAAQLRYAIGFTGVAGHAGTTSMPLRRDALAGAAEAMLAVESIARADASDLVATVGRIEASPGAPNVIPGRVRFTLDVRAGEAARRDRAANAMLDAMAAIAEARDLSMDVEIVHDLPASPCAPDLMAMLDDALAAEGQPARRLVSGAGHDAMVMAALCPTAMLFIRCGGGISHNPAENVAVADVDIALRAMLGFIDRLGETVDV